MTIVITAREAMRTSKNWRTEERANQDRRLQHTAPRSMLADACTERYIEMSVQANVIRHRRDVANKSLSQYREAFLDNMEYLLASKLCDTRNLSMPVGALMTAGVSPKKMVPIAWLKGGKQKPSDYAYSVSHCTLKELWGRVSTMASAMADDYGIDTIAEVGGVEKHTPTSWNKACREIRHARRVQAKIEGESILTHSLRAVPPAIIERLGDGWQCGTQCIPTLVKWVDSSGACLISAIEQDWYGITHVLRHEDGRVMGLTADMQIAGSHCYTDRDNGAVSPDLYDAANNALGFSDAARSCGISVSRMIELTA